MAIDSGAKQASAACCATADGQMYRFCASRSSAATIEAGATSQPSRQPVMLKYLEKLLSTIASSSSARAVVGAPSYDSPW